MRARTSHGLGHAGALLALISVLLAGCNFSGRPAAEPATAAAPKAAAAPAPVVSEQGPGTYSAFPGDTVYGVAQRFGVPVRTLIDTNGLKPPYRLVPGQRLNVPVREEHVVQGGDSLRAIARIYGVDQSSLARANNLSPPYALKPGQRLVLPGRIDANLAMTTPDESQAAPTASSAGTTGTMSVEQLPPPPSQAAAAPATTAEAPAPAVPEQPTSTEAVPEQNNTELAAIPEPAPRASQRFLWPVKGQIISQFGAKKGGLHNDGINIAAATGTNVVAADNGVVAYAGNELRGFGNLLLIRHADGWVTAYAHNTKLLVKRGQKVQRGQPIAQIGSTGNVSSPQLHFEIRRGTDPVDPMKYLGS